MDMKLFDEQTAAKFGMSVDIYNKKIIEKINKKVSEEDMLIIGGIFTKGNFLQTLNLVSQIKAKKTLINREQYNLFSNEEYIELGFNHIWNVDGAQKVKYMNKDYNIIVIGRPEYISHYKKEGCYVAAAGSDLKQEDLYKDKILNISLENWGFCPIETQEQLPQIFDDMELFNTMEETTEIILPENN